MPIEFRCSECNKLLRTGDDTAGRQAKCPECGVIMDIPSVSTEPSGPTAPVPPQNAPSDPDAAASPFGGGDSGASPFGTPGGMGAPPPNDPTNPYQSPAGFADEPVGRVAGGQIVPTPLDMGDIFSHTWDILKQQFWPCLGAVFIVGLISNVTQRGFGFAAEMGGAAAGDEVVAIALVVLGVFVSSIINVWLGIGQAMFLLKIARGQEAPFGTLFAGGPHFWPVFLASMLFGLIVLLGYVLLIVPGIIFALMYSQYFYLIIDREMGVMESLETSKQIMLGNKATLFAIYLVSGFAAIIVVMCTLCLGIFLVGPYLALMGTVIYLVVTGQPTARHAYDMPPQAAGGIE